MPPAPPAAPAPCAAWPRSDARGGTPPTDRRPPPSGHPADLSSPAGCGWRTSARVRIRHDHLVAQPFEGMRHPLALRRRLEQHPRPRARPQQLRKTLATGADPPLDEHLPALVDDADPAFPMMDVDPDVLHGWPPSVGWWGRGLPRAW